MQVGVDISVDAKDRKDVSEAQFNAVTSLYFAECAEYIRVNEALECNVYSLDTDMRASLSALGILS